jgi:hypothetical protein
LISLLRDGTDNGKYRAAGALGSLAGHGDATIAGRIVDAGGIAALLSLLCDGTDEGKDRAAGALGSLAEDVTTRGLIADAYDWEVGGVQDGSEVVRDIANFILGNIP